MRISVAPFALFKIVASPLIAPTRFTALAGTGSLPLLMGVRAEEDGEGISRRPVADISNFYRSGRSIIQGLSNWDFEIEFISPCIGHCTNGQLSCNSPGTRGVK